MKTTVKKLSLAGAGAFLLTGLLLSLAFFNSDAKITNLSTKPLAQTNKFEQEELNNSPPTYLLIAIGVVGIIGIRRKKAKNKCDASCRAPQPDIELGRESSVHKASSTSTPI